MELEQNMIMTQVALWTKRESESLTEPYINMYSCIGDTGSKAQKFFCHKKKKLSLDMIWGGISLVWLAWSGRQAEINWDSDIHKNIFLKQRLHQ